MGIFPMMLCVSARFQLDVLSVGGSLVSGLLIQIDLSHSSGQLHQVNISIVIILCSFSQLNPCCCFCVAPPPPSWSWTRARLRRESTWIWFIGGEETVWCLFCYLHWVLLKSECVWSGSQEPVLYMYQAQRWTHCNPVYTLFWTLQAQKHFRQSSDGCIVYYRMWNETEGQTGPQRERGRFSLHCWSL